MSFGKNPQQLGQVTGFGGTAAQKAAHATRRKPRTGGGRPYWVDTFRPNTTEALWMRPIAGKYITARADEDGNVYNEETPWIERIEHYWGRHKAGALCSAGPLIWFKDKRDACYGCDEYWAHPKDQKTISIGSKFGIGAIDYRNFHKMPSLDKQGNIRTDKNGQPFMEWGPCLAPAGCMGCQSAQEHKQGHNQPWFMSKTHFNQLMAYNELIGKNCGTCFAPNSISTNMWICGNPQCGDMIFDMTATTVSKEQLEAVVDSIYTCKRCQIPAYPIEIIQCANCTPQGGEACRASIFDCDLLVKLIATGDGDQTTLLVQQTNGPCPVQAPYDDLLQYSPNLDNRFPITSLADQAKRWKLDGPRAPQQGQQFQSPQQFGQNAPQGFQPQQGQPQQHMGVAPTPQMPPAQQFATPYVGGQQAPQQQGVPQRTPQGAQQGFQPQQQAAPAPQMPPQSLLGARAPQPANQPPLQHGLPPTGPEEGEDEYNYDE